MLFAPKNAHVPTDQLLSIAVGHEKTLNLNKELSGYSTNMSRFESSKNVRFLFRPTSRTELPQTEYLVVVTEFLMYGA